MATGFESVVGGVFMLIFNAFFSILLLIVNCTAVGFLSADKSWFNDAITIWLSTNTIVSFATVSLLIIASIMICYEYRDPCGCSLKIVVMFWVTKFGLVIWGTYEYVNNTTPFENSAKMALAVICLLWIGIGFLTLITMKALLCSKNN